MPQGPNAPRPQCPCEVPPARPKTKPHRCKLGRDKGIVDDVGGQNARCTKQDTALPERLLEAKTRGYAARAKKERNRCEEEF
jgi:hypothetical protein